MTFYCPMTGNIILENGEKFASPALLFHFSHKQNELSFPTIEIQQLFDETLEEVENGNYDSYKIIVVVPSKNEIKLLKDLQYYEKLQQLNFDIFDIEDLNKILL